MQFRQSRDTMVFFPSEKCLDTQSSMVEKILFENLFLDSQFFHFSI